MKAIALYLEPNFKKFNLDCSFAFIKGRGVNPAIARIHELLSKGKRFYFEADIIDFFGSVDREVLWQMFSKQIKQRSLLELLRKCFDLELENLEQHETEFQNLFFGAESGIPQGGILSPMLANFYLHQFDKKMLRSGFEIVRYADDFVVMCESLETARKAHIFSRDILGTLNLRIHTFEAAGSKSRIGDFSKDGLLFLGICFEGKQTFPSGKAVDRFKAKIDEVLSHKSGDSLFKTLQRLANLINGWGKCYRRMRVNGIYLSLDNFIKTRVRTYLDQMGVRLLGKNPRRQMKFLGIPSLSAMVEHSTDPSVANVKIKPV